MKGGYHFAKCFSASLDMIVWFLYLLCWNVTLTDFRVSNQSHFCDKPHLVMVGNSFCMSFNFVRSCFAEDFRLHIHRRGVSIDFISCEIFAFGMRTNDLIKWIEKCSPFFGRVCKRIGINSKYIFGRIKWWTHLGLGFTLWAVFFFFFRNNLIPSLQVCSDFLFFLELVLVFMSF